MVVPVFGTAFLLSGLAVAVEAICKVTGNPLPAAIDGRLCNTSNRR